MNFSYLDLDFKSNERSPSYLIEPDSRSTLKIRVGFNANLAKGRLYSIRGSSRFQNLEALTS